MIYDLWHLNMLSLYFFQCEPSQWFSQFWQPWSWHIMVLSKKRWSHARSFTGKSEERKSQNPKLSFPDFRQAMQLSIRQTPIRWLKWSCKKQPIGCRIVCGNCWGIRTVVDWKSFEGDFCSTLRLAQSYWIRHQNLFSWGKISSVLLCYMRRFVSGASNIKAYQTNTVNISPFPAEEEWPKHDFGNFLQLQLCHQAGSRLAKMCDKEWMPR